MSFQRPPRAVSVLAGVLAAAGTVLGAAGCSHIAPLGPDPAPYSLPPARGLGSAITVQVMRGKLPTPAGRCPAGSVGLFGLEPDVPRVAPAGSRAVIVKPGLGGTATHTATPTTSSALPVGVACYVPVGRPVTITSAAVSSVSTYQHQPGPAFYGFVVAFPAADIPALTAVVRQAYDSGDAVGMSVAGKLWQAPQIRHGYIAFRGAQIYLLSRSQAFQLHRLLVPSG